MEDTHAQRFRALPPDLAAAIAVRDSSELSHAQQRIVEDARKAGITAVWGAPGTGKTAAALTAVKHELKSGADAGEVLVLAPTRTRAAALREIFTAHATTSISRGKETAQVPMIATPTALAFSIVAAREAQQGNAVPALVTGADHDAYIAQIVAEAPEEWAGIVPLESLALPGFRTELRDVMARAAERGVTPESLAVLGAQHLRPEWSVAARAFATFRDALRLSSSTALEAPLRLDGGQLIDVALACLSENETLWRPRLLVADDVHDLTAGGVRLLTALVHVSRSTLLVASPDSAVETFRGGLPDAASRIIESIAGKQDVRTHMLAERPVHDARLSEIVDHVRERLPLAGAPAASRIVEGTLHGRATEEEPAARGLSQEAPLGTACALDDEDEARVIATVVRALSAQEKVPFDDIAIVCRSSGAARDLADRLGRHNIEVEVTALVRPLRDEFIVRDVFAIIEAAQTRHITEDTVLRLLRGPFADADDLRIRAIRRWLLRSDPEKASSDLCVEAFMSPEPIIPAAAEDRYGRMMRAVLAPLERLRRMRAATEQASRDNAGVQGTLWAAWEAAGVAGPWQEAALQQATVSDRDQARLMNGRIDAFNALLTAADRYEERAGGEDIDVFIANVRAGAVPEDTLSARARIRGKVRVMTPAAIAGMQFNTVVLAGLNEGTWPNVRIRSTLLGAGDFALACDFPEAPVEPHAVRRIQREAVIADEVRMAVASLSRATHRVFVTAADGGGTRPSALFRLLEEQVETPAWSDAYLTHETPGPFPSARELVASLRNAYETSGIHEREQIARMLARLVEEGITEADPHTWYHREPSTRAPVVDADAVVPLSPSALETAHECPRAFLLERAGAERGARDSQSLGTLVHALAQDHPTAGPTELITAYVDAVGQPGPEATWHERAEHERAISILEKLGAYQEAHPDVIAVERSFAARLGTVRLRGSIDRIERDPRDPHAVRIVDYKTSAQAVSNAAAEQHLQLGAYQYALTHADGEDEEPPRVSGASLVFVGTPAKKAVVREQAPAHETADPAWFEKTVSGIEASLRADHVALTPNAHCGVCTVKSSCPLYEEGTQL